MAAGMALWSETAVMAVDVSKFAAGFAGVDLLATPKLAGTATVLPACTLKATTVLAPEPGLGWLSISSARRSRESRCVAVPR